MVTDISDLMSLLRPRLADYLISQGIQNPYKHFSCFVHDDKTPGAVVHKSGDYGTCFGCNFHFDIFTAAAKLEGFPLEGPEFLKENVFKLADQFGIKYSITSSSPFIAIHFT